MVINLTNQIFGNLTVIERDMSKTGGAAYWICECSCGNKITVRGDRLRKNEKTNCGCIKKSTKIDTSSIVNNKYNYLTVLERDMSKEIGHGKESYWLCKCECGNITSIRKADLINNHTKSCGCLKQKQLSNKNSLDLTNKRFGKILCIKNTGKKNNHNSFIWECLCDCGNIHYSPAEDLNQNKIHSCGCSKNSHGENLIQSLLDKNNIDYIKEYSFLDCRSPKNKVLRFDFAILNNNKIIKLIEFDGKQHFEKNDYFGGEEYFYYLQECDNIKNDYAKQHNIPLLRISYKETDKLNIDYLLS